MQQPAPGTSLCPEGDTAAFTEIRVWADEFCWPYCWFLAWTIHVPSHFSFGKRSTPWQKVSSGLWLRFLTWLGMGSSPMLGQGGRHRACPNLSTTSPLLGSLKFRCDPLGANRDLRAVRGPGAVLKQYWNYFLDPDKPLLKLLGYLYPTLLSFLCSWEAFSSCNGAWTVLLPSGGVMISYLEGTENTERYFNMSLEIHKAGGNC